MRKRIQLFVKGKFTAFVQIFIHVFILIQFRHYDKGMDKRTTARLNAILHQIDSEENLQEYIRTTEPLPSFSRWFFSQTEVQPYTNADLIRISGIERTYFYQIQNGTRKPGRDKVLLLCLSVHFSMAKTQRALEICSLSSLYPKNRRDAILIFAFENSLSVNDTQHLLDHFQEAVLA
jgi:hypothetical protein